MKRFSKLILISLIYLLIITGCRQLSDGSIEPAIDSPDVDFGNIIVVSSPVGREIYNSGEIVLVRWDSPASLTKVNIFLYKKSMQRISINTNIENIGEIMWQIPDDIASSNHYRIKLVNSHIESEYGYSGMFGIQSE